MNVESLFLLAPILGSALNESCYAPAYAVPCKKLHAIGGVPVVHAHEVHDLCCNIGFYEITGFLRSRQQQAVTDGAQYVIGLMKNDRWIVSQRGGTYPISSSLFSIMIVCGMFFRARPIFFSIPLVSPSFHRTIWRYRWCLADCNAAA